MAVLLPNPKAQFFDDDGNPLVGGKVYFFEAGSSVPLDTFTNATGNTANDNPVILNARGEADIWLTEDTAYKVRLDRPDDSTVWTVDSIIASGSGGSGGNLGKVLINATDPVSGFLSEKLLAGTGINLVVTTNPAGDTITINSTGATESIDGAEFQESHGFDILDSVYWNGAEWVNAQADNVATLGTHIVTGVTDIDNFTVTLVGERTVGSHGLNIGEYYYTSATTPGGLVASEPSISNPMIYVVSATRVRVLNYRPSALAVDVGGLELPFYVVEGFTASDIQVELDKANVTGGTVYMPRGDYVLETNLFIGSNTHLKLDAGATITRANDTIDNYVRNYANSIGGYDAHENISISGGRWTNTFSTNCTYIAVMHVTNFFVSDCIFTGMFGWHAVELNAVFNGKVSNCRFSNDLGGDEDTEAIQLDSASSAGKFPWETGVRVYDDTDTRYVVIDKCLFSSLQTAIGSHSPVDGVYHRFVNIQNCQFTTTEFYQVRATNWRYFNITDCKFGDFKDKLFPAIYIDGFLGDSPKAININDNSFVNVGTNCIEQSTNVDVDTISISNNTVVETATGDMDRFLYLRGGDRASIVGNVIEVPFDTNPVLEIDDYTDFTITGNTVIVNSSSEIWLQTNNSIGALGANQTNGSTSFTSSTISQFAGLSEENTFTELNNFTGGIQKDGVNVPNVQSSTDGNLAGFDANGNLIDAGPVVNTTNLAKLNEENVFQEINTFEAEQFFKNNEFNTKVPVFAKTSEVGAQYERIWSWTEVTDGTYIGRWIIGTGSGSSDGDVYYSDDRGLTWTQSTGTLSTAIRTPAVLYVSGDIVLAGFKGSTSGSFQPLYRSTDGGQSFTVTSLTLSGVNNEVTALVKTSANRVIVTCGSTGGGAVQVFYSDNTTTYTASTITTSELAAQSAFVNEITGTIYVGTANVSGEIHRSTDNGVSFTLATTGSGLDNFILDFGQNPRTGAMFAFTGVTDGFILKSTDDGVNWSTVYTGLDDGFNSIFSGCGTPDGRVFFGGGTGAEDGKVGWTDDDFETAPNLITISTDFEAVRVLRLSARFDIVGGLGSSADDGDLWVGAIYNRAIYNDQNFIVNCRDYGFVYSDPTDAYAGDRAVINGVFKYFDGSAWI